MKRLENLFNLLKSKKLDAVLISDEYNMRYLSGCDYEGYFFATHNRAYILTDSRYTEVAENESKNCDVITLTTSYGDIVKEFINDNKIKTLGFEDLHMTYDKYVYFSNLGATLVPIGNSVETFRQIKDEYEIEALRTAESIGDKAFDHILGVIKPGMTEMEIAIEIELALKRNGAEKTSFDTIVASGINGSMPHAVPGNKKVQIGELITMDFGCKYKGYCSDMTRTIMLGEPNDEQRKIYNVVLEAQLKALDFIRAGVKGKDVDKVARDTISEYGYGKYFGHGLGHSVGLFIHEGPNLSPREERIIQENMIETIEPGIYVPGFGGVRIEDMVLVTKNGCENLAKSKKELIIL